MFRLLFVIGHVATGNGTRRYISLSHWTRANESEFRVVYFFFYFLLPSRLCCCSLFIDREWSIARRQGALTCTLHQ